MLVAETGAEGDASARPAVQVCRGEVAAALEAGVPVEGICLYPVWTIPDGRTTGSAPVGLLGTADADGRRAVYAPLALEVRRQQALLPPCLAPAGLAVPPVRRLVHG